ncbi:type II toxin-antitoxin system RelE family toxin [Verminephrobacter eiseniae]|uniref:type II toxin-antitoxin system RelE family toxin n=1 Tax=Verminephrobacter eiseniae TaxID=364317 RepID=UPI002AA29B3C|nr:hypothetical protein [Verminephrobacter eiseniae]
MPDCYKIKLRSTGLRLVYRVHDDSLVLLTIAVGTRDKSAVYDAARLRLTAQGKQIRPKASSQSTPRRDCANNPSVHCANLVLHRQTRNMAREQALDAPHAALAEHGIAELCGARA